jgi:hypothetical protein
MQLGTKPSTPEPMGNISYPNYNRCDFFLNIFNENMVESVDEETTDTEDLTILTI